MDEPPWFRHYEEGVPRTIPLPAITLPEALGETADRFPERVALRFFLDARLPVPALTYRQLQDETRRFATALFQLGVRKGDRVALMLPNCPQLVVAFYGALRVGAIPVNTNPLYVSREMREQFEDSGARRSCSSRCRCPRAVAVGLVRQHHVAHGRPVPAQRLVEPLRLDREGASVVVGLAVDEQDGAR